MKLYRKHLIGSAATIMVAVGIVAFLTSKTTGILTAETRFDRRMLNTHLTLSAATPRSVMMTAVAGIQDNRLYFQTAYPNKVLVTDPGFKHPAVITLNIPTDDTTSSMFTLLLNDNGLTIAASNTPALFESSADAGQVAMHRFPQRPFTRVVLLPSGTYVFRGRDTAVKTRDQTFFKGSPATGITHREDNVSKRAGDYGLSTDGMLTYDSTTNLVVYIPFYGNTFMALDTNLHKKYEATTINDKSTVINSTGIAEANHQKMVTNTGPKRLLNTYSCVDRGILYIRSEARSQVQPAADFASHSTIDLYHIASGEYKGSCYLPDYKGEKPFSFRVIDQSVIALYHSYAVNWRIQY